MLGHSLDGTTKPAVTPTPGSPPVPPGANHTRWFEHEVFSHDAVLKSYLRGAFPTIGDVDDVVQESYLRIWKARTTHQIEFAKAFLFKVARNMALNLVQRQRVSPISAVADLAALPVLDDGPGVAELACTREEILLLADGLEALPARCREIVILRRIKGMPQKEIAALLGISEQTVQAQIQRGVKRCEEFLRRRGVERGPLHV